MVDVKSYSDYRIYLRDFLAYRRQKNRRFTDRQFCQKVGLSTGNYVQRIIRGQRNLSPALAEKFVPVLGLNKDEATYFRSLVALGCARTDSERIHYLRVTSDLRSKGKVSAQVDNGLLRHWYLAAIWELAACANADMTPAGIVKALANKITKQQAAESLLFLVAGGYLEPLDDGRYRKSAAPIYTSDGIPDPFVRLNHSQMLEAAQNSLELPLNKRLFYGMGVAIDSSRLPEVERRMRDFLELLHDELGSHVNPDAVYRFGLHTFPLASVVARSNRSD